MDNTVSIVCCPDYNEENVRHALTEVLLPLGGLYWVKQGMKIAIKANLVSFLPPARAATTHPALLCELTRMLTERGAEVIIGDSPGGLYNAAYLAKVYSATGMKETVKHGAKLNDDYSSREASFPDAKVAKSFTYTGYLDNADAIINFCKLKSHGMMGMSCAVKNMFGVIPGTIKPEYHFRYPDYLDFADMIIDLNQYFAPKLRLCICDAVVGMEGNGPTAGEPRQIGALLASASPYHLDLVAADIIGLKKENVPLLEAAHRRGLAPTGVEEVNIVGDHRTFFIEDFKRILTHTSIEFKDGFGGSGSRLLGKLAASLLRSKPYAVKKECVGCGICADICPAKALTVKNGLAVIDRQKCIRCFCCQEFCPKGAMKVKRTLVAHLLVRSPKK